MRRLICDFVVRIWNKEVFSWLGSFSKPEKAPQIKNSEAFQQTQNTFNKVATDTGQ